jgi:tRNA (adenine37-N6)-methyltransferase
MTCAHAEKDTNTMSELRDGEVALPFDPGVTAADAHLVFIGKIHSPWADRAHCPHNLREALERGGGGTVSAARQSR